MFAVRIFLFGALLTAACTGCRRVDARAAAPTQTAQAVEVVKVQRLDMAETLQLVGSVAANESAAIRPEMTGLVRSVHFEEGQRVERGQLLMKIEDSELRAQLGQSESAFRLAELNLQRTEQLWTTKSNSQADVDRSRSEFASARSDRELINVRLERTQIRAPFDGIVGARTLSPGDYVTPQSIVTTIDDLSRLKIDFQVPERFAGKVRRGTTFIVQSSASAESTVNGEVYFISSVVDRATRASEVKGFLATEAAAGLKPGMFANVELVLDVRKDVLAVPEGAVLTTTRGTQLVAVKEENGAKVAEFIAVKLGLRANGLVQITPVQGSLDESREIVASGVGALILFEGAKLEARPLVQNFGDARQP